MNERQIFEGALDCKNPADRKAFLEQVCGGNAELLARVAGLLASHDARSEFLQVPAVEQLREVPSGETRTIDHANQADDDLDESGEPDLSFLQPSPKPGSIGRLGHFEILQVLGQGAFGIVFRAFDEKLHRQVAIKVMNPQLAATSPPRKRFIREARSVAAIKHENIVQVHNVEEEHLPPYLVMEFVQGQTLQQKLDASGPLDISEFLHLARQMAAGLAAAHEKGLIHRDIKPGNILIEQGVEQKVKITDFGLARAADDASMTRTGVIAGTPLYMAPEQALGESLDARSDLFSLGSVLYQMACGRAAFRAPNTIAVLRRVVEETPRDMAEVIPELPPWLVTIVMKLLEKEPAKRYQSAKEVAELLGRCQSELQATGKVICVPPKTPPAATPAPVAETVPAWRTPGVVIGGVLTLVVLMGVVFWIVRSILDRQPEIVRPGPKPAPVQGAPAIPVPATEASPPLDADEVDYAAERKAAEWVLKVGGSVRLVDAEGKPLAFDGTNLPAQPFALHFADIQANPELQDDDLKNLARCRWLFQVSLGHGRLQGHGLAYLERAVRLQSLQITSSEHLTDAGLASLSKLRGLPRLTYLTLSEAPGVTDATLEVIDELPAIVRLELVGLPGITDEGLGKCDKLPALKDLVVETCQKITDRGLAKFFVAHPQLTLVGIANARGESRTVSAVGALKELQTLECSPDQLTDEGIRILRDLRSFEQLQLHGDVSEKDAQRLLQVTQLRRLIFAPLAGKSIVRINHDAWKELATLPLLEQVYFYTFAHPEGFDDAALIALAAAPKLKEVALPERYLLTDAGIEAFRQVRPDVRLKFGGKEYPTSEKEK